MHCPKTPACTPTASPGAQDLHLQRRTGVVEGDAHSQQPHAKNDKAVPVPAQAVRTKGSPPIEISTPS